MKTYEITFVGVESKTLQTMSVKTNDIKGYVEMLKKHGTTIYDYMEM
jgi:hypothetical protein